MNSSTGVLSLNKELNYQTQRIYHLYIRASNILPASASSLPKNCKCSDPSLVTVIVTVDGNSTKPVFTYRQYNSCKYYYVIGLSEEIHSMKCYMGLAEEYHSVKLSQLVYEHCFLQSLKVHVPVMEKVRLMCKYMYIQ